jgi:Na+/melibiose symporter-like transporter
MPMWLWLAKRYGKRPAWLMYNLVNSVSNIMFIFVGACSGSVFPWRDY